MNKVFKVGQEVFVLDKIHFDNSFFGKIVKFANDPAATSKTFSKQDTDPIAVEIATAENFAAGTMATCSADNVFGVVEGKYAEDYDGGLHKVVYNYEENAEIESPYYCPDFDWNVEESELVDGVSEEPADNEKIVILPLELTRDTANSINGKTFKSVSDLESAIRAAYAKGEKDEQDEESLNVEDLIDELGIYTLNEFVCQLNDEIYPTDQWVARVFIM
jgi:sulfur carrier protein ThiS